MIGPHHVPARVGQRQADEAAARVGIGVRRALAGEIGQEEQPLAAGRRRLGRFGSERSIGVAAWSAGPPRSRPGRARCGTIASEPPPERFTPIMCHLPRTAWQKVCSRPSGSNFTSSLWTNITPEVPIEVLRTPLRDDAVADAPAAQSPAPPTTTQSVDQAQFAGRLRA